jgi:hypothetical protein
MRYCEQSPSRSAGRPQAVVTARDDVGKNECHPLVLILPTRYSRSAGAAEIIGSQTAGVIDFDSPGVFSYEFSCVTFKLSHTFKSNRFRVSFTYLQKPVP